MTVPETIEKLFVESLRAQGVEVSTPISPDLVLLQSGLDSLGFATLIVKVEQELGYDPFVLMENPFYPQTYREFVDIYDQFAAHRKQT